MAPALTTTGFIAIYRWRVAPEHEAAFRAVWRQVTREAGMHGGHGSCLTRADNGDLVAIAPWPSLAARDRAFAAMGDHDWPPCERISEWQLDLVEDLWAASPFTP